MNGLVAMTRSAAATASYRYSVTSTSAAGGEAGGGLGDDDVAVGGR